MSSLGHTADSFIYLFQNLFQVREGLCRPGNVMNSWIHGIWCEELLNSHLCPQRHTFCFADQPTNNDFFFSFSVNFLFF